MHWILVLAVVLLLFGTGRLSSVMGDFAKGIKAFKKNMAEEETAHSSLEHDTVESVTDHTATNSALCSRSHSIQG
jgi:sec-independent protein translocase protein TatA